MFKYTASLLALALNILTPAVAQTTAVAPILIDRTGWVVTADSAQPGNEAVNVLDENPATFWHTGYNPDVPLPHFITVDMGNQYVVNGYSYLPRQDGNTNGNVGAHTIDYSVDGNTWTTAVAGTWANDQTLKVTMFTPVIARFVRLAVTSEASGNGYAWSSAAEINVLTNPHPTLSRLAWTVSADSAETSADDWGPTYAIDGSPTTFWHTQWVNANPPLPHSFTIDQGAAFWVGGLSYLPRPPSSGPNGRIGQYTVAYSGNGNTWTNIASGTWADTQYQKLVEWNPVSARYWRITAITEAGNRGPWTSAAEINLLDGSAQGANFKITVDSQETAMEQDQGTNVLDGKLTTFWHTLWSGNNVPGFPHYIIIDMQAQFPTKALQYTPRQDGNNNGNIGDHVIDVSTDGNTWITVSTGSFLDDPRPKLVNFKETVCRYVRLTATSEAGNRGPWSSAAEILISYDVTYTAPAPQTKGEWGLTIDFPLVPVAVSLLYNTGGVIAWSSYDPSGFTIAPGGKTVTAVYNPANGKVSSAVVTNTNHDMFCPGISLDFNGRAIVTGGNDAPRTSIYSPANNAWTAAPDMNIGRGYQSSQTLSDGRIFTIGGSWSGGIGGKNGEYYSTVTNTWTMLPNALVAPMMTNDAAGTYRADNHAWLFAWKNTAVLQAGPSVAMNWYTTTGNGGVSSAGARNGDQDRMCGNAVMYDAVAGKVLTMGGSKDYSGSVSVANTYHITIGNVGANPNVQQIASMAYRRIFANGVVLPTGQVFVVGGQEKGAPFTDDSSIMYPELWNPTSQTWSVMAPMSVPRNYHSVAVLLPDATVLVGGGGLCDGCSMNHYDGQIFTPPYLFTSSGARATRPVIKSLSGTTVGTGGTLTVNMDSAVATIALLRMGSATHTVDTDQRRIVLTPASAGANAYRITIPSDPGIALPGYWMVFGVNAAGVPSTAQTIKITTPIVN